MIRALLSGALLIAPVPAWAQAQAPAATAVDPARLAAARSLIDAIFPPATREQMIAAMLAPMMANIQQGFAGNAEFTALLGRDPRVKAAFDRFMAGQIARTTEMMRGNLPGMVDAMATAYARRFDVAQLRNIGAFFATPTGRAYMQASMTIMGDPDIAAWQRRVMTEAMSHTREDVAALTREIAALQPDGKQP